MNTTLIQSQLEVAKKWRDFWGKIPFFSLPQGYKISIKPPITMADARFLIERPDGKVISVYLDLHCNLGHFGDNEPHWEVYPDKHGDNSRVALDDMKGPVELITFEDTNPA